MANCLNCVAVASALGLFFGGLAAVLQLMSLPNPASYPGGRLMLDACRHGALYGAIFLAMLGVSETAVALVATGASAPEPLSGGYGAARRRAMRPTNGRSARPTS